MALGLPEVLFVLLVALVLVALAVYIPLAIHRARKRRGSLEARVAALDAERGRQRP